MLGLERVRPLEPWGDACWAAGPLRAEGIRRLQFKVHTGSRFPGAAVKTGCGGCGLLSAPCSCWVVGMGFTSIRAAQKC